MCNPVVFLLSSLPLLWVSLSAQAATSSTVLFSEPDFPSIDSAGVSSQQLAANLPGAQLANANQLPAALTAASSRLLVLPFGSAFPEEAWPAIKTFLDRGGNLLVLGGMPFTRSAYQDRGEWRVRDYSVRFIRRLMIDQYQETPGSDGLQFQTNPELTLQVRPFAWKRAFSPVIRLSAVDLYHRGGAAGSIDARLDSLAWGAKNGRRMSAPAVQVDHYRNGFDGGRWIFVNAELPSEFFDDTTLVQSLAERALQGAEEFTVRPVLPLYLPGEPLQMQIVWNRAEPPKAASVKITSFPEGQPSRGTSVSAVLPSSGPITLAAPNDKGLYLVEAQLMEGDRVRAVYHSGFWIRDESYLHYGPHLSVNHDYFEVDDHPLAVIGTTYMSSEVQRLYFEHPNVYVWNQDLAQIHDAGLNMIRTGWWTGWDKFCDENGQPYERTLRTLEAYLMTARKYGLPVQFNFFAFLPDVLGGTNAFLDPEAVRKQQTLISSLVARFHDVPFLAWDLINEPSFSQHLWTMRPNGDPVELASWNRWLSARYPDRAKLAALWNVPPESVNGEISVPLEDEFSPRGMYTGTNSLKVNDYFLFAQETFASWARTMHDTIRAAGSQQLVTVGQDEGGIQDRLSPAFWGQSVDFTTNHSWWQNDSILWDSLAAKQPGEALLIQETGLQRELNVDEIARRTPENEAALLERKIATSFIQGSGAIEWLWNTNSYMTESNETPIGAVRTDYTEKPEASVLRAFAQFAPSLQEHLRDPQQPSIVIITSQAAQYSVLSDFQLEAQRRAVRAVAYDVHLPAYIIPENQIGKLGSPKLAILPSPQALGEPAWRALLHYVDAGGSLLITGPVDRDEHWQVVSRARDLALQAHVEPLTYHAATVRLGDRSLALTYGQPQQNWLDSLRFEDGATFKEIPHGKGRIFWTAYPVELSENEQALAEHYADVVNRLRIAPMFNAQSPLPTGVVVYPTVLADAVLYVFVSDSADPAAISLRDQTTGVALSFSLPAEHAAIAVIGKREKKIVAKYGF
ncbi:MAG TPA: cellulase family glycosylhydrolase [Candidatus Sulfotelmatobacter sp.]|nr:cellulase family glycosylhydrolase [Candidatus Sulfotelmatobacter sp.]